MTDGIVNVLKPPGMTSHDVVSRIRRIYGVKKAGNVLETKPVPDFSAARLEEILQQFRGKILQVPPMYSALKVNGKKLYEYARQGIELARSARPIEIFRLELIRFYPPYFCLDIACSKGTYVRTLLEDIAAAAGTCACMTFLLRTRAGDFCIEESHTLEEIFPLSCRFISGHRYRRE